MSPAVNGGTNSSQPLGDGDSASINSVEDASTATSTNDPAPVPPEKFLKSPGGVDMRSGELLYSHTDLAIGGAQGLQLTRQFAPVSMGAILPGKFGGFSHNWDIRVNEKRISVDTATKPSEYDYQVSVFGARANTFRAMWPAGAYDFSGPLQGGGTAGLTFVANPTNGNPIQYTYWDSKGETIAFRPTNGTTDLCGDKCAYAASMSDPDGTTYTFSYDSVGSPAVVRLRSVRSNRGYALLFDYSAVGPSGAWEITKACALNLGYTIMPAITTGAICPAGVPTSTYSYTSGALSSFVDQTGVSTLIGANGSALYWPGDATPYATNSITITSVSATVNSQTFADGRSYTYSWVFDGNTPTSSVMGGSYTDNNGKTVTTQYGKYRSALQDPTWYVTAGPETVTDEIGRSWTYNYGCSGTGYCQPLPVQSTTAPENNSVHYTYDGGNNISEVRQIAKPGSGLADIVTTRTSGFCDQPATTTDANGHTTNYTYASHCGLLTQMGPAPVASGARPLTVNTYAQRYAWTKNASGVLTQETVPVWVLSTTTVCQTVAGTNPSPVCDGAPPQTVTTYEYGASGTAESLLVKGVAVASGGTTLRTCYSYDPYARKISETKPNANLSVCP